MIITDQQISMIATALLAIPAFAAPAFIMKPHIGVTELADKIDDITRLTDSTGAAVSSFNYLRQPGNSPDNGTPPMQKRKPKPGQYTGTEKVRDFLNNLPG